MHRHRVTRILPFQPEQLFDLVAGVDAYPEFVPWITGMHVEPLQQLGPGVDRVEATSRVGFAFLTEQFTTEVTRDRNRRAIRVRLVEGPFKRLENDWNFEPHPTGCKVIFYIDFQFRSKMLDFVLAANFDRAVDRLIACFEARAEKLYGRFSPSRPEAAAAPAPARPPPA